MNIMGSCVSFLIKVQILAFYTDVCTAPYGSSAIDIDGEGNKIPFLFGGLDDLELDFFDC